MNVGVAYADKFKKVWLRLEVPDGSTVQQAIEHSGLLTRFPEIDLSIQRVGIFGKLSSNPMDYTSHYDYCCRASRVHQTFRAFIDGKRKG